MSTREPKHVSPPRSPDETLLGAWDLLSAMLGVGVAILALADGTPFLDSCINGIRTFGVLAGGLRIVAAVAIPLFVLYEALYGEIEYWVLRKRVDWQVGRMMRRPLLPAAPRAPAESLNEVEGASAMKGADVGKAAAPTPQAEGSGETAHLAEIAARFLAGKPLSALTEGISAAAAADLTAALALAGRIIEVATQRRSASNG